MAIVHYILILEYHKSVQHYIVLNTSLILSMRPQIMNKNIGEGSDTKKRKTIDSVHPCLLTIELFYFKY